MASQEEFTTNVNTRELVKQALATFDQAHRDAEIAAAAFVEVRRLVGGNEADRKLAKANTPPELYEQFLADYATAEATKSIAAAHIERVEKNLNVQRELLAHEVAELWLDITERRAAAAEREDVTAQRYVMMRVRSPLERSAAVVDDSLLPY